MGIELILIHREIILKKENMLFIMGKSQAMNLGKNNWLHKNKEEKKGLS